RPGQRCASVCPNRPDPNRPVMAAWVGTMPKQSCVPCVPPVRPEPFQRRWRLGSSAAERHTAPPVARRTGEVTSQIVTLRGHFRSYFVSMGDLRLILAGTGLDNDNRGVEALGRSVVDGLIRDDRVKH